MRRAVALAAGLTLVSVACGSTVQQRGPSTEVGVGAGGGGADELGQQGGGTGVAGPDGGVAGPAGGPVSGSTGGGRQGGRAGGGAAAGSQPGTRSAAAAGVTATEITVGRIRTENADAYAATFGFALPQVDTARMDKIMVDEINGRGGVAGRKIKINYVVYDPNNEGSGNAEQRACSAWTEDAKVYAALQGSTDTLKQCLHSRGVPQVYENVFSDADSATFAQFPAYFEINALDLTRAGRVQARGHVEQRFFEPAGDQMAGCVKPVCVGLLTWDANANHRAVDEQLVPTLKRAGVTIDRAAYVQRPITPQDTAAALSQLPGIVFQMKSAGVNRLIIFADIAANLAAYFSRAAASQDYHPRYGLASGSGPQTLIDSGLVDPRDFRGSVVVGWNPTGDIGDRPYTGHGPNYEKCMDLMQKGKADLSSTNARVIALRTCDGFWFFEAAASRALPDVGANAFRAAAEGLGSSFPSALAYGVSFGPTRHSGVAAVRYAAFDDSCTCFMYTSGNIAV